MVLSYKEPDKVASQLNLECCAGRDSKSHLNQPPIGCLKLFPNGLPKGLPKAPALEASFPVQHQRAETPLRPYLCGAEIFPQDLPPLPFLWVLGARRTSPILNSNATLHCLKTAETS